MNIRDVLAPITYADVVFFRSRLELRHNREKDLKASSEILRGELLLGQEDQEVC